MSSTRLSEYTETINDWKVRHLTDGRVEMRKYFKNSNVGWNAWGSCYEGVVANQEPLPYAFAERPMARTEISSESTNAVINYELFWGNSNPLVSSPQLTAVRPNIPGAGGVFAVMLYLTGVLA